MDPKGRKAGKIYSWIADRGFFFIAVRESESKPQEKYYGHISRLTPNSKGVFLGASVTFEVNPTREGTLPSAINIEVVEGGVL